MDKINLKNCPKCNGALSPDRGYPFPIAWTCVNCGLTSESGCFYDAIKDKIVEIPRRMLTGMGRRYRHRGAAML